jgi:hypothetical protein
VSVSSEGVHGDEGIGPGSVSADGRFLAFSSAATNFAPVEGFYLEHAYVRDTLAGTTTVVGVDSAGVAGNMGSYYPSISGDGRYVAFESPSDNLVAGDTNNWEDPDATDIFVHDRDSGITTRVSVDSAGMEANDESYGSKISGDGRYVVFTSFASNLASGDTNPYQDVFLHDRNTGITSCASRNSAGSAANGHSNAAEISGNGRYVAFISTANDLVADDTNGVADVFVHDRDTGATTRVSLDSAGNESNKESSYPAISSDGRYVTFGSSASNLVPGDSNNKTDIFVHDRQIGVTTRVSIDSDGNESNGVNFPPAEISDDGRYVIFRSLATNLVVDDINSKADIFVHDRHSGITTRVSVDALGAEANGDSTAPKISNDGRYVVFDTYATNLVPDDLNYASDVIIRAFPNVTAASVVPEMIPVGRTTSMTITGANFLEGTTVTMPGAVLSNIVIVDESTITLDATVELDAPVGERDISVLRFGTGPGPATGVLGQCANCVTLFDPGPVGC